MNIDALHDPHIQDFIHRNRETNPADLALSKWPDDAWPKHDILNQIKSYQKAKGKLQSWTTCKGIIFPIPDLIEQASSETAANYKAKIVHGGDLFIDLTGGTGSDSVSLSRLFKRGICVDADEMAARLLRHNLPLLTNTPIEVDTARAEDILASLPPADLIYIDPQRRRGNGSKGLIHFSDMSPDLTTLLPRLMDKADQLLIKASPFMDITQALQTLPATTEIHVVEINKNCKECLYLINTNENSDNRKIFSAILTPYNRVKGTYPPQDPAQIRCSDPLRTLYEPGPALMKSGLHTDFAQDHDLLKIAPLTHLYTAAVDIVNYPGRIFEIIDVLPVDKKKILEALPDKRANISCRNFPLKPEELRQKLGLKDGGDITLFGCTLQNGDKRVIICKTLNFS
jgi:hypothetical protein